MASNILWLLLVGIPIPFVLFFFAGIFSLKRKENEIREFYWALREKYFHSYIKQNKIIKFIRKCLGLETKKHIHWITCLLHYIQIVTFISTILVMVVLLFVPREDLIGILWLIGIAVPFGVFFILLGIFHFLQLLRCEIIKKKDPKYSKREFHSRGD